MPFVQTSSRKICSGEIDQNYARGKIDQNYAKIKIDQNVKNEN